MLISGERRFFFFFASVDTLTVRTGRNGAARFTVKTGVSSKHVKTLQRCCCCSDEATLKGEVKTVRESGDGDGGDHFRTASLQKAFTLVHLIDHTKSD